MTMDLQGRSKWIRPRRRSELWTNGRQGRVSVFSDARVALDRFELNEVGGLIWHLLDGRRTVDQIAREVQGACPTGGPTIESIVQDVVEFLEAARSDDLVTWAEDSKCDVLLVVPPAPSVYSRKAVDTPEYSSPPLGLCYLAATLRLHGYSVAIVDLHQQAGEPEDIVRECRKHQPAVVGITASTPSYPNAVRVGRFVRAWNSDCKTIIGGPHATGAPRECVSSGVFDLVCVGEGEETIVDVVRAVVETGLDPRTIRGLCHAQADGTFARTAPRARLQHLDSLPLPARDLLDLASYHRRGALIASRGCPIGCNFCACAAISGNTYRARSVESMAEEVQHLVERYSCRSLDFHDDTFNFKSSRVLALCRVLSDSDVDWGCFCRAPQFTPALAQAMVDSGCKVIQFGVESGSDSVLRSLGKQLSTSQVESAVRAAAEVGIEQIVCGFIIGHATDTAKSIRESISFGLRLADLGATRLTLSVLTPYPGTAVYRNRRALGIRLLSDDWEEYTFSRVVAETEHLKGEELRRLYVEGLTQFLSVTRR